MTIKLSGCVFLASFALTAMGALAGCSSNDGAIAVDAAATPLTAQANDALFTVRITEAREGGYDIKGLVVKVTPDGKDAITVSCTPGDKNTNSKLDKDESIVCAEGAANVLDATYAGKDMDVEVFAQIDGKEERIGDATWTVAK